MEIEIATNSHVSLDLRIERWNEVDLNSTAPCEPDPQVQGLVFTQTLDQRSRRRNRQEGTKREEDSRKRREWTETRWDLLSGEAMRWSVEVWWPGGCSLSPTGQSFAVFVSIEIYLRSISRVFSTWTITSRASSLMIGPGPRMWQKWTYM